MKHNDISGAFRHLNKRIAKVYFCDKEGVRENVSELDGCDADEDLLSQDTRTEIMSRIVRVHRLEQQADRLVQRRGNLPNNALRADVQNTQRGRRTRRRGAIGGPAVTQRTAPG